MRLPPLHVLATQPWHESGSKLCVKLLKCKAFDPECDTRAEMANTGYLRSDLATLGGSRLQFSDDPPEVFTRQPMKHRQVSPKEVSIRRKMRLSKAIEGFKVCLRDPGGEDEWFAGLQAKVLSMLGGGNVPYDGRCASAGCVFFTRRRLRSGSS